MGEEVRNTDSVHPVYISGQASVCILWLDSVYTSYTLQSMQETMTRRNIHIPDQLYREIMERLDPDETFSAVVRSLLKKEISRRKR